MQAEVTAAPFSEEAFCQRQVLHELIDLRDSTVGEHAWRRGVKQLLARWHPDKNPSREDLCTRIFTFIQSESDRILNER
jgi:hypothetical protein